MSCCALLPLHSGRTSAQGACPPAVTVWLLTWAPLVKAPLPWTLPYSTSDAALVMSVNRGSARLMLIGWGTRGDAQQQPQTRGDEATAASNQRR